MCYCREQGLECLVICKKSVLWPNRWIDVYIRMGNSWCVKFDDTFKTTNRIICGLAKNIVRSFYINVVLLSAVPFLTASTRLFTVMLYMVHMKLKLEARIKLFCFVQLVFPFPTFLFLSRRISLVTLLCLVAQFQFLYFYCIWHSLDTTETNKQKQQQTTKNTKLELIFSRDEAIFCPMCEW